ncbi:kynureninase [Crocinitomicaceae bacterium]|jgi:kynureninase|nr:kynureninase [Crocinitomicaceae bacterium]MDB4649704.1 kynureninase [Crocinitomicaceae bacterium]
MTFESSLEFAKKMDANDPLNAFREKFLFPDFHKKDIIYFTGNSLGLQPKSTRKMIEEELDDWAKYGVEGHFMSRRPWYSYHEQLTELSAYVVGAKPIETVITHSLTTNIHLLMVSFYQPNGKRTKILCEKKAFPSDQYALMSQLEFHGYDKEHLIEIGPRDGEETIQHEDILDAIEKHKDELALVFMGGVNYYTGQFFNLKEITKAGHKAGAVVGFDLAHAAGNVNLSLHDWNIDFATWCSYKYLNSSPGGVSGIFVHEKHAENAELKRFAGWWGHDKEQRFLMEDKFIPIKGAEGWQLSNAPVLGMAAHLASLQIFKEAGMERIGSKRDLITAYLEYLILKVSAENEDFLKIITPNSIFDRGSQLSLVLKKDGKKKFDLLTEQGIIADWREPNVIRIAPAPLYNSFEDCWHFAEVLGRQVS